MKRFQTSFEFEILEDVEKNILIDKHINKLHWRDIIDKNPYYDERHIYRIYNRAILKLMGIKNIQEYE